MSYSTAYITLWGSLGSRFTIQPILYHFGDFTNTNYVKIEFVPGKYMHFWCSQFEYSLWHHRIKFLIWTASSEFGTYRLCEQRRFRRACASALSRQNLRCSLIQAVSQEELSDRKPDPWPLWMAGHAQLKFVMTECSKTQIRLTGLNYKTRMPNLRWYKVAFIIVSKPNMR